MKQMKKRIIRRIAAVLLAAVLGAQPTVWAAEPEEVLQSIQSDLDYIEDVYRFDLGTFNKPDTEAEQTQMNRSAFTVVTLGIMETNEDGSFLADETVPFNEFAKIIMRLSVGKNTALEDNYDAYQPRPTLVHEAATYLVGVLGYSNRERKYSGAHPSMRVAAELGLFGKQVPAAEAQITTGELADMIAKALHVDLMQQTAYGNREAFETVRGETLLTERFESVELDGLLTGVKGVDIYGSNPPETNRAAIDRVEYRTNGENYNALLGRRVFGYARLSEYNDYVICGLTEDDTNPSLTVAMADIEEISDRLVYQSAEGKSVRQSLSQVRHVVYNYSPSTREALNSDLLDYDGTLTLSQSSSGTGYDVAVICAESSFRVQHVSAFNERIYLKDGMNFNGQDYIDIKETGDNGLSLTLDGKAVQATDLTANDVISVMQNKTGTYTVLAASRKIVAGTVTAIDTDKVWIDGVAYPFTRQYRAALESNSSVVEKLKPGMVGKFNLSVSRHVAGFDGQNGISYGIMTQMKKSSGLGNVVSIKVFSQSGEWITPDFDNKLELDGVSGVTATAAYQTLCGMPEVFYKPIRYRLNENGKVNYLDTVHENTEEQFDTDAMRETYTWNGKLDWTQGYNLTGVNYSILSGTIIFSLPENLEDEEDYEIIRNTSLEVNSSAEIGLYCADEFCKVPLATYVSRGSGTTYFIGKYVMAVERVATYLDEKGEERIKLTGKESVPVSPGVGSWAKQELTVSKKMLKRDPNLVFQPGDVFFYLLDGKGDLDKMDRVLCGGRLADGKPTSEVHDTDSEYAWGKVVGLDFEDHLIKLDVAPEGSSAPEYKIFMPRGVQIWDAGNRKFINAVMEDITVGDTVLATGNVRHVSLTVFRS